MDILTEVLKQAGLRSRVLQQRSEKTGWKMQFPCNRSMGFHVVMKGSASIQIAGHKKSIDLQKGDIALMARGVDHEVSNVEKQNTLSLISGAYQLWNDPIHPLFENFPNWLIIRSHEIENHDSIQTAMKLLSIELVEQKAGSARVIESLLDLMFSLILRKSLETHAAKKSWYSEVLHEDAIKKSIEILQKDYKKEWSLELLAKTVGLSRAGFAAKFRKTIGQTPLHYLNVIRMQKAMQILLETDQKMDQIAGDIGFKDAFSFSKSFKKTVGVSPKVYRNQKTDQANLVWRY